jgi:hypothetical protein
LSKPISKGENMKSGIVMTQPSLHKAMEFLTWHDDAPYRYWIGSKRGKQEGLSAISLEIQYVGSNPKPVSETEGKLRARVASISMPSSSNLQALNSSIVRQIPWGDLIQAHSNILAENLRVNNLKVRSIDSARKDKVKINLDERGKKIIGANGADTILISKIYSDLCIVSTTRVVQRTADLLKIDPTLVTMALRIARRNKWLTSAGAGKSGGELTSLGETMFHFENGDQREAYFLSKG